MIGYYHQGVGLDVISQDGERAVLGRGPVPVMVLEYKPQLARAAVGSAGLYHTAILFDSQAALASAVYSVASKYPRSFTGSSDHLVSKALYFDDPEGNGVELYWDRPRDEWRRNGSAITMGTEYLDPNAFLQEHLTDAVEPVFGESTFVGHVHLQVGSIAQARDFYVGKLGFEVTAEYGTQALFVSAGGYHHHVGMNTWHSAGAGMRSPALGLGRMNIVVPTTEEILQVNERLTGHGVATRHDGRVLEFDDPWANLVTVSTAS
jgi:catechol 2,3-dioxygenase